MTKVTLLKFDSVAKCPKCGHQPHYLVAQADNKMEDGISGLCFVPNSQDKPSTDSDEESGNE